MNKKNSVLLALGAIALGSAGVSTSASAQEADGEYQRVCDWLSGQTVENIEAFIRQNPESDCLEVAAQLLAERTQPEAGVRAPSAFGRY